MNDVNITRNVQEITSGPPSGYFVVVPATRQDESLDLAAVVSILAQSWKVLLGVTLGAAILAAAVSLQLRKTYRAQAIVAPVTQGIAGSGGGALRTRLSGIASLAGIDLGSTVGDREESIATLTSSGFAREFILSENLMPILFAEKWDSSTKGWRTNQTPPTLESAVKKFTEHVRSIREDRATGMLTVAAEWYSPELAARWANKTVELANERLRTEAIRNANLSIEYLNRELAKATVVGVQQAIYRLIEEQVNNAMLANVQQEYAFRFIDRAVPPETRASPRRTLMVLLGAAAGLLTALVVVFIRRAIGQWRERSRESA